MGPSMIRTRTNFHASGGGKKKLFGNNRGEF